MADVKCFWLTPTDRFRIELRRFVGVKSELANPAAGRPKCPRPFYGYHTAHVAIGIEERTEQPPMADDPRFSHDDPRWPVRCECGYAFTPSDQWQVNYHRIFTRSEGGAECTLREAPPGAMYDAIWYPEKGPDGRCLMLVLPDSRPGIDQSVWPIDGPCANGGHWTRTGEPPLVTASPSILTPGYHGWLRAGVLVEA
jgi:hypothetical protein